jgi:hypothetical protein
MEKIIIAIIGIITAIVGTGLIIRRSSKSNKFKQSGVGKEVNNTATVSQNIEDNSNEQ